ncbi:MAG: hypothetical protein DMG24_17320, partial [Acidobacteria bacterium]
MKLSVLEGRPAVVDQGNPAVQVTDLLVGGHGEHIIGVPVHVARQVGGLDRLLARVFVIQQPDQRGLAVKVLRQVGENQAVRAHAGDDLVRHLPHRTFVVREQRGLHVFFLRRVVLGAQAYQHHFLAHILVEQLLRVQQVVLVVLLENGQALRRA